MNRRIFLILLVLTLCAANLTRWAYRSRVGGERFSAESASHFRYTGMVASGEGIPAIDVDAQYPEGLDVFKETSVGMEYVYGLAWRLIPGSRPPLDVFVRWFSVFLFTLSVIPLAFLSRRLWERRSAGVVTAVLFAVAIPVAGRSSGFDIIRENLTLPLIVFHAWLLVRTVRTGSLTSAVLSGLFMFAALATWQGTQFYLAPLVLFLAARSILRGSGGRGEDAAGWAVVLAAAAAAAAVPFLRAGAFYTSPSAALCAGLGGILAAGRIWTRGRRVGLIRAAAGGAAVLLVLVPAIAAGSYFSNYSHFLGLIAYKLRFIYKPSDPTLLPFDVRAFWVGPFNSPDLLHLFVFALPLAILTAVPIGRLAVRVREGSFIAGLVSWLAAVFLLLFLLMMRMLPFFGVFAVVIAGGLTVLWSGEGARRARVWAAALFGVLSGLMVLQLVFWQGPYDLWRQLSRVLRIPSREKFVVFPLQRDPEGAMLDWISENTGERDVVMSLHYLSPQILTYTGRPVNLNDFFEAPVLRAKAREMLRGLYSSERTFLSFCERNGSDYLVLSSAAGSDPTGDSPLFQAGFDHMPPGCAAYMLMFEPMKLESFDLVYENEVYRVFRVGEPPVERRRPASPIFYSAGLLWRVKGDIRDFYDTVMHIYAVTVRASRLMGAGQYAEAEGLLAGALRIEYFYPAWNLLDILYAKERDVRGRLALAEFALTSDPWRASVNLSLAESRLAAGDREGAADLLTVLRSLPMSEREKARYMRLRENLGSGEGDG